MQNSPSPSPVSPFTMSAAEIDKADLFLIRWTPLVLIVIIFLALFIDQGLKHLQRSPTTEPPHQPRRRRWLMGLLLRHQPSPPAVPQQQQPTEPIGSFVCKYRLDKAATAAGSGSECAICLEEFKYGDECRMFVICHHGFHRRCIDEWLARDHHCPLCRGSIRGVRSVNVDEV